MQAELVPKVSVCVTTFNHEKYVRKCLDSILAQKTSFRFEVIVHDDASHDSTPEIILEYARIYPSIIVPILRTTNCFSSDRHAPLINCAIAAKANFIAICEGDDYWIDVNKLQVQNEILDNNQGIFLTVAPGRLEVGGEILKSRHCYHGEAAKVFYAQDVLDTANQFAPTASYFCHREILVRALTDFRRAPVGDLFIEIYAGLKGGIYYHPKDFSVYRVQTESSWSSNMGRNPVIKMRAYIAEMECAIEDSREIAAGIKLDWSAKKASMYYGLAFACLENRLFEEFICNIERSVSFKVISQKQLALYRLRHLKYTLMLLRTAQLFLRRVLT